MNPRFWYYLLSPFFPMCFQNTVLSWSSDMASLGSLWLFLSRFCSSSQTFHIGEASAFCPQASSFFVSLPHPHNLFQKYLNIFLQPQDGGSRHGWSSGTVMSLLGGPLSDIVHTQVCVKWGSFSSFFFLSWVVLLFIQPLKSVDWFYYSWLCSFPPHTWACPSNPSALKASFLPWLHVTLLIQPPTP